MLGRARRGRLSLTLPDRETRVLGGQEPGPEASLTVGNYAFFKRLALSGDIGFGESYQEGEWSSPDLTKVIEFLSANLEYLNDRELGPLGRWINRLRHSRRANSLDGSKRNIQEHYDLSNELYQLFLDETLTYSGAIFESRDESLESAQLRKIQRVLDKARLKPGMTLLEIGSGWGTLAIEAAKRHGVKVLSLTLSHEQLKLARERAADQGLSEQIEFRLMDYRQLKEQFDRIVSVEMLEAVGHEYLPAYFKSLDRLLKRDGLAVLQVISVPDDRYEAYRKSVDWIQKHIFPGAVCPSLGAIQGALAETSLGVEELANIGADYAATLKIWRGRFLAQSEKIRGLGFSEKFIRSWDYYFAYCEGGFRQRMIRNYQITLTRSNNLAGLESSRGEQ